MQKQTRSRRSTRQIAELVPHSWSITDWPSTVFPNSADRAKYLVRVNRRALIAEGALSRAGRALVVFGGPFARWLQGQQHRVPEYRSGAARTRDADQKSTEAAPPPRRTVHARAKKRAPNQAAPRKRVLRAVATADAAPAGLPEPLQK